MSNVLALQQLPTEEPILEAAFETTQSRALVPTICALASLPETGPKECPLTLQVGQR